jgi:hypothetical protein
MSLGYSWHIKCSPCFFFRWLYSFPKRLWTGSKNKHKNASLPEPKDLVRDLQLNPPQRFASSVFFDYKNSDVYPTDFHAYESLTIQLAAAALSGR